MWDVLLAFFTLVKVLAIIGLAIVTMLVTVLVLIYLVDETKLFRAKRIKKREENRLAKEAVKAMETESWEAFFFDTKHKSFHDTGEIIRPTMPPVFSEDGTPNPYYTIGGTEGDLGMDQESK